jgi:modulator of FtsH protease
MEFNMNESNAWGKSAVVYSTGTAATPDSASMPAHRVLRNTYALLALTLTFSAAVAAVSAALRLPHPGILLTLVGYFGLLFATYKLSNSVWGLAAVFALTGFMGYTLGPIVNHYLAIDGGGEVVAMAFGGTALIFFGLSAWVLTSKRDFSFMGGFLFAGMIVALLAGLAAVFFQMLDLSLAVSAAVVLLMSGMILFETSRIVNGGETNYILATVSLFVSIFNLFTSLLQLLGFMNSDD